MYGPQTARSTLTWLVVSFVLTAFQTYCCVFSSQQYCMQHRYWSGLHWPLPSQSGQSHPRSDTAVHHCSTEHFHSLSCHGKSSSLVLVIVHSVSADGITMPNNKLQLRHIQFWPQATYKLADAFQVGLLDRLGRIVPKGLDTHIFANSGSEVVENAIKMARAHTKKTNIICFDVRLLLSTFKSMLYVSRRVAF